MAFEVKRSKIKVNLPHTAQTQNAPQLTKRWWYYCFQT